MRLLPFFSIFLLMAILEACFPRRALSQSKQGRWLGNLSLLLLNTVLMRLFLILIGTGTVALALWSESHHLGLLSLLQLPPLASVILAILLLDLVIYWQHRLFHVVPWLWRLHQVHHADRDLDVSSGLRFHPIEMLLSMLIKLSLIVLIGAPAIAVLLFEIILNGMAMFNHANVRLPLKLDYLLRFALITPDAHRIHHSTIAAETNSNYGFNLSVWDRLFGSYHKQPQAGHTKMCIGLNDYQHATTERLDWMLMLPWIKKK